MALRWHEIADKLSDSYLTRLDDGRTYGETLLDTPPIYVGLVERLPQPRREHSLCGKHLRHGWRKLMRATQSFAYHR